MVDFWAPAGGHCFVQPPRPCFQVSMVMSAVPETSHGPMWRCFFFPISCVSKWGATLDTKKLLQLDVGPFKDGVLEVLSLKKPSTNWETTQILLNLLLSLRKTMIAVIIVAVLHQCWTYPLLVHSSIWYCSFVNLVRETDPVGVIPSEKSPLLSSWEFTPKVSTRSKCSKPPQARYFVATFDPKIYPKFSS